MRLGKGTKLQDRDITTAAKNAAAANRRIELIDADCPGLRIRLSPKGKKTWALACRDNKGSMRRFPLGTYPDIGISTARKNARNLHNEVKINGADPIAARRKAKNSTPVCRDLAALLEIYAIDEGYKKKRWKEARKRVESIFSRILREPFDAYDRFAVQRIADRYPSRMSASAAMRYLRPILKWGVRRGFVEDKFPHLEPPEKIKKRTRVLSEGEIRLVLAEINKSDRVHWNCMKFMLLTMARREEAGEAKWKDIDFKNECWKLLKTKNEEPHLIPLSKQALELLSKQNKDGNSSDAYIFATEGGGKPGNWDRETKLLFKATGTSGWTRHDLRRTAATAAGNKGVYPFIVEAALNHKDIHSQLASVYNKSTYREEVKQALNLVGEYIDELSNREN